jgi:hypothetical protein
MKKTIIFIFGVMVTAAHAKLDKMMKEVFENQIKKADFYDAPKAIQGRYVPPIANQNYLQLIEKYLPDIKDTMYNSCAPALKRADQLPLSSLYSLTLFTENLIWAVHGPWGYVEAKMDEFKRNKSLDEIRKTSKEEEKKWKPLEEEMVKFAQEHLQPAYSIFEKHSDEEKKKAKAEANFYFNTSGDRNIIQAGRWISMNLENDFCNLK